MQMQIGADNAEKQDFALSIPLLSFCSQPWSSCECYPASSCYMPVHFRVTDIVRSEHNVNAG